MTESELPETLSEKSNAADSVAQAEPEAAEPQPEPWTPARVIEWNAYYDIYVAIGVLLLAFVASANEVTHSTLWTWLRAGRTMAAQGRPLMTDVFSYTETGARWVNIPWIFEWSHALLHDGVMNAAPVNPADPIGTQAKHEQFGAAALGALAALARATTVLVLLFIRRPGPGLWWSSVVAALAFGAFLSPTGPSLGGIAGTALVAPATWGTLLLALQLYFWHRAVERKRPSALWALVPLFLLWANIDESFLIGLFVLAAGVLGLDQARKDTPLPRSRGLGILGACVLLCLANPSVYRIFPAAISPLTHPLRLSPLVPLRLPAGLGQFAWVITIIYLACLAVGFGSFVLNRRRFSLSRLLMFAVAALVWAVYLPERDLFAVVFAATVAINGQEWYHDRFGSEGRLESGWTVWSVGGRLVTIALTFTCVVLAVTGWKKSPGDPIFGFGFNPDAFAFEVADYLRTAKIQGRVLNTTREQGDALIWRAYPTRQTFIDSRNHVFSNDLVDQLQAARKALSTDDVAGWKPLLDKFEISAVIIDEANSPKTYQRLLQSPNWILFYDDGAVVLFGRADASAADVAFFRAHQLNAESLAFHQSRTVPPPENTPVPVSWIDQFYRNKFLREPQPHTNAALHWLQTQGGEDRSESGRLPDPAHCLMAIQEARTALAHRSDDTRPYRVLSEAYRLLMIQESALLAGIKLSPENMAAIVQAEPRTNLLMYRFRQRATALNAAIQTTPVPASETERQQLFTLNFQLFQLYSSVNFLDLARDRLQAALAYPPEQLNPEMLSGLTQQLVGLNQQVKAIVDDMNDQTLERQLNQLQRAAFARSQGAPGLALVELEEAERTGVSPAIVRPQLIDLYGDTGQPEKSQDLINTGNIEDPSLETEPGAAAARQARVNFLLGFYEAAAQLWEDRAILRLRQDEGMRALGAGTGLLHGQAKAATTLLLEIPAKVGLQAAWQYDLGICELETGRPDRAAAAFTEALTLAPDLTLRPVAAYYLEKLGKPVPPPRANSTPEVKKATVPDATTNETTPK
jgi:tetratricopeptide (TPR) repeat protein